ncbi:MAG: hypothetical protein ACLQA5_24790 [Solirubrobacteraceae bacterium]
MPRSQLINKRVTRLRHGAADGTAGTLDNMFSFHGGWNSPLFLNPSTGEPIRSW